MSSTIKQAKQILAQEQKAIALTAAALDQQFDQAIQLLQQTTGKVVICGVGKSGQIGKKIAASMSSTGTPAFFMHGAEAAHGDLGMLSQGDCIILLSHSGRTDELLTIIPAIKQLNISMIAMVGNLQSPLAKAADVALHIKIDKEACSHNLAPSCSTTATLALGDCLALVLSDAKHFKPQDFALFHPGGNLGAKLTLRVCDLIGSYKDYAMATADTDLIEIVNLMTASPTGALNIVNNLEQRQLVGLITEGDIRRALTHREKIFSMHAQDIMTRDPITIKPDTLASQALELMENRPSQISVLTVVDENNCVLGILRIHDVM